MKKTSLVGHVLELTDICFRTHNPIDKMVGDFFRRRKYLGSTDRRFIAEALYGIIRNRVLLEAYIREVGDGVAPGATDGSFPPLFLYTAYALRVSRESPEVVSTELSSLWEFYAHGVDVRGFCDRLVTANLPPSILDDPSHSISTRHSFPRFIVHELLGRFGAEESEALCTILNTPAPTTIRVNTLRTTVDECAGELARNGIESSRTVLSPVALTLGKRINADSLPSFRQGMFEMQDEGSQVVGMLVDPRPGMTVVDACAGSGGKTLHLAAMMENEGRIIACDTSNHRLSNIHTRFARAGVSIAEVVDVGKHPGNIEQLNGKADQVLVDAPCSGIGTVRRNPGIKLQLTEERVKELEKTQQRVLGQYAEFVAPGGRLIYATCSFLKGENESRIEEFLSSRSDFQIEPLGEIARRLSIPLLVQDSPFVHLLPHIHGTDGFFIAALKRISS